MKPTRTISRLLLIATLMALMVSPVIQVSAHFNPIQADSLEALFDSYAESLLSAKRLPGMTVIVVDANQVLLAKGYGLANPSEGRAFHPEDTVVSAASVAKVFTALATLQLYERGYFQLDDDVNAHLRAFKVPDYHGLPLTIRQLLTHTDGFEARIIADAIRPGEPFPPLRLAAQQYMPRRILPPGEQLTYGSYASNLLGVLVEDLSGMPFEEYMEENILQPLGMKSTTFRRPLPEEFLPKLAPGCTYQDNEVVVLPLVASRMAPQGGLYTTAADMGRFLQMLLNRGALANARVAKPETIDLMFTQQFTDDPRLPGITFGLFEVEHRGQRLLVRDGDGLGTRSRMVLIPSAGIGLFVSYNSDDEEVREGVVALLLEHLFPSPTPSRQVLSERTPLTEFEGLYRPLQWDQTTPGKLLLLFANVILVQPDPTHADLLRIEPLVIGEAFGGFEGVSLWREREPLLFEVVQRERTMLGETILFERDASGQVTYLRSASKYHGAFVKMAWHENPAVQWAWLALCGLILASALVWLPGLVWALIQARRKPLQPLPLIARALGLLVSVLFWLLVLQAFGQLFAVGGLAGIPPLALGISPEIASALNQLWLPAAMTLGLVVFTVLAWLKRYWSIAGRVHYTLVTLAALGLVLWLHNWNLLGLRL